MFSCRRGQSFKILIKVFRPIDVVAGMWLTDLSRLITTALQTTILISFFHVVPVMVYFYKHGQIFQCLSDHCHWMSSILVSVRIFPPQCDLTVWRHSCIVITIYEHIHFMWTVFSSVSWNFHRKREISKEIPFSC